MTVINKYTQHPPTKHPEPFVVVSITIEDKSYDAYWHSGYDCWMVDLSREDDFDVIPESELGYWIYGTDTPEKIIL